MRAGLGNPTRTDAWGWSCMASITLRRCEPIPMLTYRVAAHANGRRSGCAWEGPDRTELTDGPSPASMPRQRAARTPRCAPPTWPMWGLRETLGNASLSATARRSPSVESRPPPRG